MCGVTWLFEKKKHPTRKFVIETYQIFDNFVFDTRDHNFWCPCTQCLLVVRSSVRRWPDTRVTERRRQNKVEDSIMLFKADNLHRQDSNAVMNYNEIGGWLEKRTCMLYTLISSFDKFCIWILFWSLTVIQVQATNVSLQSDWFQPWHYLIYHLN